MFLNVDFVSEKIKESYVIWKVNSNKKGDAWLRQSEKPTKVHHSFEEALYEAKRLAITTGETFVIFKTHAVVIPPPSQNCTVYNI